ASLSRTRTKRQSHHSPISNMSNPMPARRRLTLPAVLLGGALFLPGSLAGQDAAAEAPVTPDRPTLSDFGRDLSDAEAATLLREAEEMVRQAVSASRAAEGASSAAEVKRAAAEVVRAVWGIDPGVQGGGTAEVARPGWKERWQVSGAEFDPNFVARLGDAPP